MPWIQLKQASFILANGQCLFCDVDLTIERQFIAITGPNGAGKSHLLKALSGEQPLTSGERQSHGKCFYLPQDATNRFATVSELLGLKEKLAALHRAHQGLASGYDFELISDDWQLESTWQATLAPLELTLETPFTLLSPGAKMRAYIEVLQSQPAILLLDEPSNHMDSNNKHWLAEQLKHHKHGVVAVTHDPILLDAADHILHIKQGELTHHSHGFDAFRETLLQTQARQKQQHLANRAAQKTLKQAMIAADLQHQRQANKGKAQVRAGSQSKLIADFKSDRGSKRHAGQTHKIQKAQDNIKKNTVYYREDKQQFHFNSAFRAKEKLRLCEAELCFGPENTLNLFADTTQKLRVIGENGIGKSTLLKTLAGKLELKRGEIQRPATCIYLDQHCAWLEQGPCVLDIAKRLLDTPHHNIITSFASVGLKLNQISGPISSLSGGERMKSAIVLAVQLQGFLLLDEPDNHLDLEAQEELAAMLNQLPCGFMLVSHNEYFCGQLSKLEAIRLTTS
ncbi:ATP-binding cassette domain-containing protein [Pseudoalteromonas sp. Isolate6]|uniref:ATP-binding cassette domain-containing protein n=1 Tax=Pseudoalteromonas sp. Isolate6 TaxID=2908527 RepID=UPI001EFE29BF|nr:ATP-binding cassette domain-containing protein [Pseudoalteromonas sp. Isolate6]MCG9759395.1 ATP-binding cassette domain-containing protein [Pseudoalteromonas sp. Isolate6]